MILPRFCLVRIGPLPLTASKHDWPQASGEQMKRMISMALLGLSCPFGAMAEPAIDPASPFVLGEAFPATPASCDSLPGWLDQVPKFDGRISMAIRGELTASETDGTLAYLFMCPETQIQVVCITYEERAIIPGQQVLLAGGFAGTGDGHVVLDPCLAYDVPEG